jgi:hypothetical protein
MPQPIMRPRSAPLRLIALRLGVSELETCARQPDIIEAIRVTIQYHDGRYLDQLSTLTKMRGPKVSVRLNAAYRRNNDKPLVYDFAIDLTKFETTSLALRKLNFDKLDDPVDIPWLGADLWLVERASGTFHHDLIIAPDSASGVYAEIVGLLRANFPQAVRTLNPT